ncbi:hypothetical protein DM813_19280 [Pseudomonas alkylphenolica]|uniref:Uncharacterized protein n=1 Tax=Pseudomonas alkylphenolica TaxID=237609 RepID=A0A443ZQF8_9PSED|nr:hypothetical protein [Pseudomonas alkylphenolica]RWU21329.1 hypothetical protein DM813_19280 [Pseudomonas alkylphenolica]
MKLQFRGWNREVTVHQHDVAKVVRKGGLYHEQKGVVEWHGPMSASGKVEKLSLNGAFLVDFTFEEEELRNWLKALVEADPAAALRLSSEAQAAAIIALSTATVKAVS